MFKEFLKKIFTYNENNSYSFTLPNESTEVTSDVISNKSEMVFPSLDANLEKIKVSYNTLINSDINIREFTLIAKNSEFRAAMVYIDGLIDSKLVNDFILRPLMSRTTKIETPNIIKTLSQKSNLKSIKKFNLEDYIVNSLIPQSSVKKLKDFSEINSCINSGFCAIFIDSLDTCICVEAKGFKVRSVPEAANEVVVRGSQEAFIESARTNTSMIRRIINNENLIIEEITVRKNKQN